MVLDKQVHITSLGEYIEQVDVRNTELHYGEDDVMGMTITKQIIPTKANVQNSELSKFWVVSPNDFIYNPRTHGKRIGLGFNDTNKCFLISWNNIAFRIKPNKLSELDPTYLFMNFNRTEWDRKACFVSWGSSTEVFTWEELRNIQIPLPEIEVQKEYVAVYKAMQRNLEVMNSKLNDLKLVCDGYIENLRKQYPSERIGEYIVRNNDRNTNGTISKVLGLSTQKQFRVPNSRVNTEDLYNYKIVHPNAFAFVPTTDTWKVLAFGLNTLGEDIVVSPIYEVFSVLDESILYPAFLSMYLNRAEFDRYARYHSWGSARENFTYEDMCEVRMPIPPIEVQKSIVAIYDVYNRRKQYAERLRQMINEICPILVAASVGNTAVAAAHS